MGVHRPSDRERPVHPHDTLLSHPAGLVPRLHLHAQAGGTSQSPGQCLPLGGASWQERGIFPGKPAFQELGAGGERYPHLTTGRPHFIRTFPGRVWSPFSRPQIWTATELLARNLQ